jgi:hypothetical protein
VTVSDLAPVSELVRTTWTPGTTAPAESETVPVTAPRLLCPHNGKDIRKTASATEIFKKPSKNQIDVRLEVNSRILAEAEFEIVQV